MNTARKHLTVLLALAAISLSSAARAAAPEGNPQELSEEKARQILPRADLSGLTGAQRAQFLEIAGDTFDYAGCNDTLARCLGANIKDRHALRMAELVKALLVDGFTTANVIDAVERYYSSFAADKRQKIRDDDCSLLGDPKAKVTVVEYSDYQCPHCAAAVTPLHELIHASQGKAKLCSKYFPLPGHPRAQVAAGCAEYAKSRGKFWPMSNLLFAHQDELEDSKLKSFAAQLGLDGNAMLKEVYAGKFDAVIERQKNEGIAAGVRATPTLYLNGRTHTLPIKIAYLERSVEDEVEWQRNHGGWDKE
jgi:protein-disulfide isomerase